MPIIRTRAAWLAPLAALLSPPASAAVTGVCPDGSIFIVQEASAIPCREAKRVDPSDVPPLQPDYLPRPYGWERFHRRADPNNPYNVIDARDAYRDAPPGVGAPPPMGQPAGPPRPPTAPPQAAAYAPASAAAPGLDLALSPSEITDLDEIVGLLQSVAPASVSRIDASGSRRMTVELARSAAFERRLHEALARRGVTAAGPVLLFRAEALAAEPFHANLTFVQGHVAFHPDPANPDQLALLDGAFGPLAPGQRVLGYAVLPAHLDPNRPLDVYWDDLRITAQLAAP